MLKLFTASFPGLLYLAICLVLAPYASAGPFSWPNLSRHEKADQVIAAKASTQTVLKECLMCKFFASLINYTLQTKGGINQVEKLAATFCSTAKLESPEVCSNVTKIFKNEFVKVLAHALLTPDQICGISTSNRCGHYTDPFADWEVNLNASLMLDPNQIQQIRQAKIQQRNKIDGQNLKLYRVIHISDTHVDLEYQEDSLAVCNEPLCCKGTSNKVESFGSRVDKMFISSLNLKLQNSTHITERAGLWGSYGHCDIPMRTFESALKKLNETLASSNDINYILWTGDLQPHDIWRQNKARAIDSYSKMFKLLFHYLPETRIFPTLGNHEMIPVDSFSPSNLLYIAKEDSPNWLYEELGSYWVRWLPQDTLKTITVDGFYAVKIQADLKLISLNTNFCHDKNFWLFINATDPGNQLEWLIHELQISEFSAEFVHIIGHIPPGSEDCLGAWSKNYNKIVSRFKHTITGQFFGHTHNSEFQIFHDFDEAISYGSKRSNSPPAPISVGFIGPSITTFIGLNPAFRIYSIDPNSNYTPVDFETYFMNLTDANLNINQAAFPRWNNMGSFAQNMDIKDASPQSLEDLVRIAFTELNVPNPHSDYKYNEVMNHKMPRLVSSSSLEKNSNDRESILFKLYKFYYSYSDLFTEEVFDEIPVNEKRHFLCRLLTSQSHGSHICKDFI